MLELKTCTPLIRCSALDPIYTGLEQCRFRHNNYDKTLKANSHASKSYNYKTEIDWFGLVLDRIGHQKGYVIYKRYKIGFGGGEMWVVVGCGLWWFVGWYCRLGVCFVDFFT